MVVADYLANREAYIQRSQARRALEAAATVEEFSRLDVFERDAWTCYLCQTVVDRAAAWPDLKMPSIDHVIPLARGGEHSLANTRCAHLGCNLVKGVRILP